MAETAVFERRDGRFVASRLGRGPWDRHALHGGAAAALLMGAFEQLPATDGLGIARVTYEFLRPVPVGELSLSAAVARPGRRVQLLEGALARADGTEVVRARALQVRRAELEGLPVEPASPPPGPESGRSGEWDVVSAEPAPGARPEAARNRWPWRPMFAPDAIEIRFVAGSFGGGPSTAWFRLRAPLIAGEQTSPLQRLAAAGDFGNGISATLSWDQYLFINPDLTIYIERIPAGEWVCLESETIVAQDGIATAESVLYDERGRVGRATQALLIARR